MTVWRFIRPLDVLYLRGNLLFGGAGDHAEALMPPWPSVFAGAIRSRMLVEAGVDLGRFTDEGASPPEALASVLGTPSEPGSFRLAHALLAEPAPGGPRAVFPLPADLVVTQGARGVPEVHRLVPVAPPEGVSASGELPLLPALRRKEPAKPLGGYRLTAEGLETWARGGVPAPEDLVPASALWKGDPRLGIARDRGSGTAAGGKLYTTDTVAPAPGVGFLVGIEGVPEELVPGEGLLRLGGDGRGAEIGPWEGAPPVPPPPGRDEPFVLYLETPGLFPGGWLPPGVDGATLELRTEGLEARLVAAAVPRAQVVSGWNVAAHAPKPAQRAVPAGAVYLFERVRGDPAVYTERFWGLIADELGDGWTTAWKQRRAEGFNATLLARWPGEARHA